MLEHFYFYPVDADSNLRLFLEKSRCRWVMLHPSSEDAVARGPFQFLLDRGGAEVAVDVVLSCHGTDSQITAPQSWFVKPSDSDEAWLKR